MATALSPPVASADGPLIMMFSKTAGFRHDSIPAGIAAITELGEQNGFHVEVTEDAGAFTDAKAVRELRAFLQMVTPSVVPDADIRAVLNRDARAVIDSIEGVAMLPAVSALREAR